MNSISLLVMKIWEFVESCRESLPDSLNSDISVTHNVSFISQKYSKVLNLRFIIRYVDFLNISLNSRNTHGLISLLNPECPFNDREAQSILCIFHGTTSQYAKNVDIHPFTAPVCSIWSLVSRPSLAFGHSLLC